MVPFPYHQGKRCNNGNANPVSCDCERVIFFVNDLAHTLTIPHERAEPMDRTIPVIWAPLFFWIAKNESITTAAMQYLRQSKVKPGTVSSSILLQT